MAEGVVSTAGVVASVAAVVFMASVAAASTDWEVVASMGREARASALGVVAFMARERVAWGWEAVASTDREPAAFTDPRVAHSAEPARSTA